MLHIGDSDTIEVKFMAKTLLETDLIPQVLSGDRKAITTFTEIYGQFMYSICFNILRKKADAEEAAQDAILKVLKSLHTFDRQSSLKAWCYTIAYRTAIDYARKIKTNVALEHAMQMSSESPADSILNDSERSLYIHSLMDQLDEESKKIVTLYYLEEKNIKEVEKITCQTESNIKIKLFRARKKMAEYAHMYLSDNEI